VALIVFSGDPPLTPPLYLPHPPSLHLQEALLIGTQVCFEIRNRGGVRYAHLVTPLDSASTPLPVRSAEMTLPGLCIGVVTSTADTSTSPEPPSSTPTLFLQPLDMSACPELVKKMIDLPGAIIRVLEKKRLHSSKTTAAHTATSVAESGSWEKIKQEDEPPQAKTSTSKKSSPSTSSPSSSTLATDGIPVFYPPLSVAPIPISSDAASVVSLSIGMVVEFNVRVHWAVCRGPIGVTNIAPRLSESVSDEKISSLPLPPSPAETSLTSLSLLTKALDTETEAISSTSTGGRVRGTIIRLTINTGSGVELAEISRRDGRLYYCESKELRSAASGNVHVGDEAEFLPVSFDITRPAGEEEGGVQTSEIQVAVAPVVLSHAKSASLKKKAGGVTGGVGGGRVAPPPRPVFKTPITMAQVTSLPSLESASLTFISVSTGSSH
jgi:hypothetical protein